ncbi:DUF5329 family protein [Dechloromonas sp.]|uniref:DUF5329 family protein n=1 Tax=Dechloromonas sp. TaxID=1917218 RepID=UPI00286DB54F|nr:DUF5329 family protein [Dechloromonas sp.]
MNFLIKAGAALILGFLLASAAHADPPVKVQLEVNALLGFVEDSGCQFYRNGIWSEAKTAETHLRNKYNYLAARNLINATGDFIDLAATESSLTGLAYKVKCHGKTMSSKQWLRDELSRLQTQKQLPQ